MLRSSMSIDMSLVASARPPLCEYGRQPLIDLSAIRPATPAKMPVIDLSGFEEESAADLRRLGDEIIGALQPAVSSFWSGTGAARRHPLWLRGGASMVDDPEVVAGVPFRYTNKWPHELPLFQ